MENCNICIVVLIGLPAAGKTTFCIDFTSVCSTDDLTVKTYSYDNLCKDYSSTSRKSILKFVTSDVQRCSKENQQFVFLIDDNMYYKSMRREYLNLARRFQTGFLQIYFDISLEVAISRNSGRDLGRVPDHVIMCMSEKLELPKSNFVTVNSEVPVSRETFADVKKRVLESFQFPMKNIVSCTQPVEISKLQYIDLCLRKLVGANVAKNPRLAEMYNKIKSVLFRNIKNGNINITSMNDEDLIMYLSGFFEL